MEFDLPLCNLNVVDGNMKPLNSISDIFITNTNPTLSALDVNEDTNDGSQLMYQTNDTLSFVDIKYTSPTETYKIPNRNGIVLDGKSNSCDIEYVLVDSAKSLNSNDPVTVVCDDNQLDVADLANSNQEMLSNDSINFEINNSSRIPTADQGKGRIPDCDDEITEALRTLGINKDRFFTNTENQDKRGQQRWTCPTDKCNFTTMKLNTFKIHLLKKYDVRPFKCKHISEINDIKCNWAFFSKNKLQSHIDEVHNKLNQNQCNYCLKVFSNKSNLKSHKSRHEESRVYQCQVKNCKKLCTTMQKYHTHMKQHTEVPAPFKCERTGCGKGFYRASSLQSHRRVHVNDLEDLICKQCKKQFRAPCRLREHTRTVHENIKKYQCTYLGCNWSFASNSKLTRHIMNKHQKIRNFKCPVLECGKSYLRQQHLQEHSLTHLENKIKFTCPHEDCLMSFSAKSSLYAHSKVHHKNEK